MTFGKEDVGAKVVADLRAVADSWNRRAMQPYTIPEARRNMVRMYEELRMLANRYESWLDESDPCPWVAGDDE